jgi:hypothetical protein
MKLFSDTQRVDMDPAGYTEPHYRYLNRSARPVFKVVRELIEDWLAEYPRFHRSELVARLRTNDDLQFEAAFFELYLHHLFRRSGAKVRIHPNRGKGRKRPDFKVTMPAGSSFLVEAVTVTEGSAMDRTGAGRLRAFYDALNKACSPDFFFHVRHFGLPRSPVPGRKIRGAVERWLRTVDVKDLQGLGGHGHVDVPTLTFEHDGCRLEIGLFPVSASRRGSKGHRPVGVLGPGEGRILNYWEPLRYGIKAKATRYGRLRQPYLVAVNAIDQPAERIDVMQALFGQESFVFVRSGNEPSEPRLQRLTNGAWLSRKGPVNTRVSAVLVVGGLLPWSVVDRRPAIYYNPWASFSLADAIPWLDGFRPVGNDMEKKEGRSPAEILRIPNSWAEAFRSD